VAQRKYDFIIVGGGSAGCALANRLSVDPATSVLVIEAGRPDYRLDVFVHMPAALTFPIGSRFYDWGYETEAAAFGDSVGDWPAFPDSSDALSRLHERFRLGVITNCDDDLFARSARRLGTEFEWVITA